MKHKTTIFAALAALAMTSVAISSASAEMKRRPAEPWEDYCRRIQLESFDELVTKTCPDLERQVAEKRLTTVGPICGELLLITRRFVPTAKLPDLATYRMMYAEIHTEICVHFPKPDEAK
jgi:hypothetical protein